MKTALLIVCGVLYGLTALLMLGAVLLQESKGGGLAALGGTRAESAFGASNPLRRLTVVLSVFFFVLASILAIALSPKKSKTKAVAPDKKVAPAIVAPEKKKGVSVSVPVVAGDDKDDKDKGAEKAGGAEEPAPAPEKTPVNE